MLMSACAFFVFSVVCFVQSSLWTIVSPKYFTSFVHGMSMLLILIGGSSKGVRLFCQVKMIV